LQEVLIRAGNAYIFFTINEFNMNDQLLLVELNGKSYLYDKQGELFLPWEDLTNRILFQDLKKDPMLLRLLGYEEDLEALKRKTGHLLIQSHAVHGIIPAAQDWQFLTSVFPCVPLPRK
jgi:hypothetical protein